MDCVKRYPEPMKSGAAGFLSELRKYIEIEALPRTDLETRLKINSRIYGEVNKL